MSSKEPYMPADETGRLSWLNNFAPKLPSYQSLLGLLAADVTQLVNDDADLANALTYQIALRDYKHGFTTWKNHLLHGDKAHNALTVLTAPPAVPVFSATIKADILLRISKMVNSIKANKNYTETIGHDLGIIGADPFPTPLGGSSLPTERTLVLKPILKGKLNKGNRPWLKWKKGKTHALKIWVDRGDGKGFVLLTVATHHTYTDMYALPAIDATAIWKYKAIFLDKHEEEEGLHSDVIQITVTGV